MSLDLDKRQRAMLREMGVRVWQPLGHAVPPPPGTERPAAATATANTAAAAPLAAPPTVQVSLVAPVAINSGATGPDIVPAAATFDAKLSARPAPVRALAAGAQASPVLWSVGEALALYAGTTTGSGPRWLVLAETSVAALHAGAFEPFEGDAGKLLDNMLRAARLHQAGTVLLAPLVRHTQADAVSANLAAALPSLLAGAQADVVLVMGRLAAQALLQSNEPFGKLRGRAHELHGVKTIVTHDAAYLLRTQADKAKAWEDLCLAISVAKGAAT